MVSKGGFRKVGITGRDVHYVLSRKQDKRYDAALLYDSSIIHLVFFKLDRPDSRRDVMSGYRHRRNAMHRRVERQDEFGGSPEEI